VFAKAAPNDLNSRMDSSKVSPDNPSASAQTRNAVFSANLSSMPLSRGDHMTLISSDQLLWRRHLCLAALASESGGPP